MSCFSPPRCVSRPNCAAAWPGAAGCGRKWTDGSDVSTNKNGSICLSGLVARGRRRCPGPAEAGGGYGHCGGKYQEQNGKFPPRAPTARRPGMPASHAGNGGRSSLGAPYLRSRGRGRAPALRSRGLTRTGALRYRCPAAARRLTAPPSSSGPGRRPLTPETGVRFPLGAPILRKWAGATCCSIRASGPCPGGQRFRQAAESLQRLTGGSALAAGGAPGSRAVQRDPRQSCRERPSARYARASGRGTSRQIHPAYRPSRAGALASW